MAWHLVQHTVNGPGRTASAIGTRTCIPVIPVMPDAAHTIPAKIVSVHLRRMELKTSTHMSQALQQQLHR